MDLLNKLNKMVVADGIMYLPYIYLNAWNNWTISYKSLNDNYLCSVCIEPENDPIEIEDTLDCVLNSGIGNARNIDDAIDMIMNYIKRFETA
jgi:hypothetical protein